MYPTLRTLFLFLYVNTEHAPSDLFVKPGLGRQHGAAPQRRQRVRVGQRVLLRRRVGVRERGQLAGGLGAGHGVELAAHVAALVGRRVAGALAAGVGRGAGAGALVAHGHARQLPAARVAGLVPAGHAPAGRRAPVAARAHSVRHEHPAAAAPRRGLPGRRGLARAARAADAGLAVHRPRAPEPDGAADLLEAHAAVAGGPGGARAAGGVADGRAGVARLGGAGPPGGRRGGGRATSGPRPPPPRRPGHGGLAPAGPPRSPDALRNPEPAIRPQGRSPLD